MKAVAAAVGAPVLSCHQQAEPQAGCAASAVTQALDSLQTQASPLQALPAPGLRWGLVAAECGGVRPALKMVLLLLSPLQPADTPPGIWLAAQVRVVLVLQRGRAAAAAAAAAAFLPDWAACAALKACRINTTALQIVKRFPNGAVWAVWCTDLSDCMVHRPV